MVAATGSGKTLIAAGCARRLAARGVVLVLVPTIELLEQTAEAWSLKGGRRGLAVAACSREEALESAEAGGRIRAQVSTQAARIADLVASARPGEPVTVYATYASLERIVQADIDADTTDLETGVSVAAAVLELSGAKFDVIILRYLNRFTVERTARAMGIDENTVRSLTSQAKAKIRARLAPRRLLRPGTAKDDQE
ncbi:sigma factor-like helix-turn-helix DNA-binding protein [Kitasatospora sp. NPDC101157]|uniref:RNA polymerase sigma factor n=1 Tax=Kitasatospora sp. NPDC101157 TaxID=3364098 RepID=UPI0037FF1FE7